VSFPALEREKKIQAGVSIVEVEEQEDQQQQPGQRGVAIHLLLANHE
jgi:hypothetical protein